MCVCAADVQQAMSRTASQDGDHMASLAAAAASSPLSFAVTLAPGRTTKGEQRLSLAALPWPHCTTVPPAVATADVYVPAASLVILDNDEARHEPRQE